MAFEWTHKEPVHMVRGNIATTTFLSTFADWWDASFQTPDFSCLTFNSNMIQRRQKRRRWYKWIQDQTKQSIHPIFTVLLHFISFHEYQDETQKKIFVLRLLTQAYKKRSSFYLKKRSFETHTASLQNTLHWHIIVRDAKSFTESNS